MPHIALGTMRMSGHFDGLMVLNRDAVGASRLLDAARHLGVDLFDTAPVYARGQAEWDLGRSGGPAASRVWTKVGVDIGGVLPRLDYSVPGMLATLQGSCRRLRRTSVECVFVHNPTAEVLRSLDWRQLYELMVVNGPADALGASVLTGEEVELLLDVPVPVPMPVMVEAALLDRRRGLAVRLANAGHRLIVRSLFSGGAAFDGLPPERRIRLIGEAFHATVSRYDPWAVVIAPRTPQQMAEYSAVLRYATGKATQ
ncbi:aldo/keto reductase [Streptantibioticus ferralitis]|uniref:Aldo/keto reductase n=1 Tax=Streptantibioticus ferralitis TaxID=236510 RepID=A0ABT5ZAZ8_9ACTN|nr:aldo/keto reductase [Streptantibioticus ferralitis]MDF2261014.1 aldo/keto reductase [Streptantibioticus ferralitis]